ncbi:MAG: stage II sporulation protein M [Acidobacteria bacterium]|nr:stage II sporulation protein M [Acidobacteriota bacterium]
MPTDRFINERKGAWRRLEELLRMLDEMSLRRLHREEVRELGRIYRRASSDLAIARAESRDPRLVNYLNSLVIRAHGRIYRTEASEGGKRLRNFFLRDFPRTFRKTWRYTATAFAFTLVFSLIGFFGTRRDADFSELVGISYVMRDKINSGEHWWESLNEANQIGGAAIMTNNIQVMFNAFALGATLGLGTLLVMAFNGLNIGAVLALTYRAGFGNDLVTFMVGHGVIELTCIFIAGGAGLLVGSAIIAPGDLSRFDALRLRGREAVHLIVGCIPLLVVAGTIEGFISPAPIHPAFKFATAAATGVALYTYLLLGGREAESRG